MPIENYIIEVFCWVEDYLAIILAGKRLRARGPAASLCASEVITMEVVGETLGLYQDKQIWRYFSQHWRAWFPDLSTRETFVRQAANLWRIKELLQQRLAKDLGALDDTLHLFDGFPVPICHFKRASMSKCCQNDVSYGYCAAKAETYYGFKGHLVVSSQGIATRFTLASAHIDERDVLPELAHGFTGLVIADKGLIRPSLKGLLSEQGIDLQTPLRANMKDERPAWFVQKIVAIRRLVETVIAQLVEQFHIQSIRAKTTWHVVRRFMRKLLAHTLAFAINKTLDPDNPLQFERLIG